VTVHMWNDEQVAVFCDPLWPLLEMLAESMRNLGACLATVGRELAAHARWRLTDPEWDAMIDELSSGPPRKPDVSEAEADRIAERIIAARSGTVKP